MDTVFEDPVGTSNATKPEIPGFTKTCCRCHCSRSIEDFVRVRGTVIREFNSCNRCSVQRKSYAHNNSTARKRRKIDEQKDISEQVSHVNDLEIITPTSTTNNTNVITCQSDQIEMIVHSNFEEARQINQPIQLGFHITLEPDFIQKIFPNSPRISKDELRQLAEIFAQIVSNGSTYRWEIRDIYISSLHIGRGSVWLGCCQSDLRSWKPPANKIQPPPQRMMNNKARRGIQRFACNGQLKLKFDLMNQQVGLNIRHDIQHVPPSSPVKPPLSNVLQLDSSNIIDQSLIEQSFVEHSLSEDLLMSDQVVAVLDGRALGEHLVVEEH
ncbi:7425_t:CDS:2 [Ambispora leptoticha]|uniref:7425_t:CDS:1 n=1 Tax=Ambispora leptoticha TaxID=144679 RepID=A0A9N8V6C9_9GLOM|nr:7425_t:CDS:2 [Ambispora leptoticha]